MNLRDLKYIVEVAREKNFARASAKVFVSQPALSMQIKKLEEVTHQQIANAFQREDLIIYTNPDNFKDFLFSQNFDEKALLLMSSGNYGGLDFEAVKKLIR